MYLINYANKFSVRVFIFYLVCLFLFSETAFGKCNLLQAGKNNTIQELVECLEGEDTPIRQQAIFAIHKKGKESIPYLISNISNRKKVVAILSDPRSSGQHVIEPPVGVLSAYIIESIVGIDYLAERTTRNIGFTMGEGSENYVYRDGFIVNSDNKIIKEDDLPKIQKIYQDWWEKNKDESICDLREKWKKGERILDGKEYQWK